MATKPLTKFTVAESNNLQVYENYSSEQITCGTSYVEGTDWCSKNIRRNPRIIIHNDINIKNPAVNAISIIRISLI